MGFTFFILLLGALIFTLVQKSEAKANREYKVNAYNSAVRRAVGNGTDNIYQFKIYCYNMRCLLALAQSDGIGDEWEPDEAYYDDYKDEISKRYCGGEDPVRWCMNKAIDTVMDHNYLSAWRYDPYGEEYYDERDLAKGIHVARRRHQGTWIVFQSGYEGAPLRKELKGIDLPRDGKTGAEYMLEQLYLFNYRYDDKVPPFSKSGITLDGIFPKAEYDELQEYSNGWILSGDPPCVVSDKVKQEAFRRGLASPEFEVCRTLSEQEFNYMIKYFSSATIGKWIEWQEHTRHPQYLNNDPQYIEACVAYLDKRNAEENLKLKPKESLRSLEIAKVKKVRNNRSLLLTNDPFDAVTRLMPDLTLLPKRSYLDSLLSC